MPLPPYNIANASTPEPEACDAPNKLLVRSAKPLKRDDIDSVSKLLAQDIETYGPLEISGREVTLSKAPEIVPSERKSALGKRIVPSLL